MKKTVVLVASPNPTRFSHKMVRLLLRSDYEVIPVGFRDGEIDGVRILTGKPHFDEVHTISLYLGPRNQPPFYEYILSLNPKRIIFNPGTYNPELLRLAIAKGIETVIDCAFIMLSKASY